MCQRPEVKERETERERQDGGPEWREIQIGWSINGGRPTNTERQQVAWGVHDLPLPPPVISWPGRGQSLFLFPACFAVCEMLPCPCFISFSYDKTQSWDCVHG